MNSILSFGKYLFAVPFAIFGLFHFMNADAMAGMAPGGTIMVYITGIALIAAAVSMIIGKFDKLAATLLALMLLLFVFLIHLGGATSGDQAATTNLLKDVMLSGAAMMYASALAKDNTIIG